MIHCRLIYNFNPDPSNPGQTADKIAGPATDKVRIEYLPDNENFVSWLHNKILKHFHPLNDDTRWIYCNELTVEEAEYVEMLAKSQWGDEGYEVIGRMEESGRPGIAKNKGTINQKEKIGQVTQPETGQLSLF